MIAFPSIQVGQPAAYEALSVFPLFASERGGVDYLLSEKALAAGSVSVEELTEAGSVPNLVVNNLGESQVLFLEGEELLGAKQNRVLNTSVLVAAHSKTVIPVSCVEKGRWRYKSHFFVPGGRHASSKLRGILKKSLLASFKKKQGHRSDQQEVWNEVDRQMECLAACSPTGAMADTYKQYERQLGEYIQHLPYVDGATGLAIGIGKRIASVDLFDKAPTCHEVWNRLLTGVIIDALEEQSVTEKADWAEVEIALNALRNAPWQRTTAVGIGDEYRFKTNGHLFGSALLVGDIVVHGSLVSPTP
jgi:hypothetical protein